MIINIRGTSGSGKSTLMRQILSQFDMVPALQPLELVKKYGPPKKGKAWGYWTPKTMGLPFNGNGLAIVGDYSNDCGGCDGVTTKGVAQDDIQDRIRYLSGLNHILFEGLLISHIYGRYRDMAKEYDGEFLFAGMDTPLEVCKERIAKRRARMGRGPLTDHKNTEMMFNDVLKVEQKCKLDGLRFVWIDHANPFMSVLNLLDIVDPYATSGVST